MAMMELNVYCGVFACELGQRLLAILLDASQSAFVELHTDVCAKHPRRYRECLEKVSKWDQDVVNEELARVRQSHPDFEERLRACFVMYLRAMRNVKSSHQLLVNHPPCVEFLHKYLSELSRTRELSDGTFFDAIDAVNRRVVCMDACRRAMNRFDSPSHVKVESKPPMPGGRAESVVSAQSAIDLVGEGAPTIAQLSLSARSACDESSAPCEDNDSEISPADSISNVGAPGRVKLSPTGLVPLPSHLEEEEAESARPCSAGPAAAEEDDHKSFTTLSSISLAEGLRRPLSGGPRRARSEVSARTASEASSLPRAPEGRRRYEASEVSSQLPARTASDRKSTSTKKSPESPLRRPRRQAQHSPVRSYVTQVSETTSAAS